MNKNKINDDIINSDYEETKLNSAKWYYTLFDKRLWIFIIDTLNLSVLYM